MKKPLYNKKNEIHQINNLQMHEDLSETRGSSSSNKSKIGDFATFSPSYRPETPRTNPEGQHLNPSSKGNYTSWGNAVIKYMRKNQDAFQRAVKQSGISAKAYLNKFITNAPLYFHLSQGELVLKGLLGGADSSDQEEAHESDQEIPLAKKFKTLHSSTQETPPNKDPGDIWDIPFKTGDLLTISSRISPEHTHERELFKNLARKLDGLHKDDSNESIEKYAEYLESISNQVQENPVLQQAFEELKTLCETLSPMEIDQGDDLYPENSRAAQTHSEEKEHFVPLNSRYYPNSDLPIRIESPRVPLESPAPFVLTDAIRKKYRYDPTTSSGEGIIVTYKAGTANQKTFFIPRESGKYNVKEALSVLHEIDNNLTYDKVNNILHSKSIKGWSAEIPIEVPTDDIRKKYHYDPNTPRGEGIVATYKAGTANQKTFFIPRESGKYNVKEALSVLYEIDNKLNYNKVNHILYYKSVKEWSSEIPIEVPTDDIRSKYRHDFNTPHDEGIVVTYKANTADEQNFFIPRENGKYNIKEILSVLIQVDETMNRNKIEKLIHTGSTKGWSSEIPIEVPTDDIRSKYRYDSNTPHGEGIVVTYKANTADEQNFFIPRENGKYNIKEALSVLHEIDNKLNYYKVKNILHSKTVEGWSTEKKSPEDGD